MLNIQVPLIVTPNNAINLAKQLLALTDGDFLKRYQKQSMKILAILQETMVHYSDLHASRFSHKQPIDVLEHDMQVIIDCVRELIPFLTANTRYNLQTN